MDNYLGAESLIQDRIRAQIDALREVSGWEDYSTVEDAKIPTPAAYVIYGGDQPGAEADRHRAQRVEQIWWVVLAVSNKRKARTGEETRKDAGVLITQIIGALMGWQPSTDFRPMRRLPLHAPPVYKDLVGYFSIAFGLPLFTTGATS